MAEETCLLSAGCAVYRWHELDMGSFRGTSKPFILEGNIRRDETPAHVAVREALVNFCIHTDYSENATMGM